MSSEHYGQFFLLGVGAQKCGTTWLNRYVMRDPAGFSPTYEFHVWDGLYGAETARRRAVHPPLGHRLQSWFLAQRRGFGTKDVLRWRFQSDPRRYFDYFAARLARPGCRLAADITPSYAGLPAEAFQRIKAGFEDRNIKTKVVFIMRDPVERCWSATRMFQAKNQQTHMDQEVLVRQRFALSETEVRTRYDRTVRTLETVFAPKDLHFAIFETLFTRSEHDRLAAFLGLEPDYAQIEKKENARPKEQTISDALRREIVEHYVDVYRFCGDRFPVVRQAWANFDLAVGA